LIAKGIWKVSAAGCSRLRQDFKTLAQSQQTTFLIVTHSIDEAIFLANRILVFGAPARFDGGNHRSIAGVGGSRSIRSNQE